MKNTIVRALALALVVTGFGATTAFSASTSSESRVTVAVVSSPTPMCPPNDPNGCGIQ